MKKLDIYQTVSNWRKELISWAALAALFVGGLELYFFPKMQEIARQESYKVLYIGYTELIESYTAIPDKKPHHLARLTRLEAEQERYLKLMGDP